jgi:hypothetical protein
MAWNQRGGGNWGHVATANDEVRVIVISSFPSFSFLLLLYLVILSRSLTNYPIGDFEMG